jgi:hypothetical protein
MQMAELIRWSFACLLVANSIYPSSAQKLVPLIQAGWGMTRLVNTDPGLRSATGGSGHLGVGVNIAPEIRQLGAHALISLTRSAFRSVIDPRTAFVSRCRSFDLELGVQIKASNAIWLRGGIFAGTMYALRGEFQYRRGSTVSGYADPGIHELPFTQELRAGIILGSAVIFPGRSFGADLRTRVHFLSLTGNDLEIVHRNTTIVAISENAVALELLISITYNFRGRQ